ncbi:MAG TPA: alpha/beta hydrolase [Stellaceae bacterium]|nr:alpha/beta hydrolase [Stellaceae bacterium]
MPKATAKDGVHLHYESEGSGPPIVFVHELSGTWRSFVPQMEALKHHYHCIAYNARGYPPSDVPPAVESYSQDIAAGDLGAVLDAAGLESAHVMGVSMGSAAALQFALAWPARARSVILCSIGSGSDAKPGEYAVETEARAKSVEEAGMKAAAENFGNSPNRRRLKDKNPALYATFLSEVGSMSLLGITNTMRGVQKRRPSLYVHKERIAAMKTPALVLVGEDDAGCIKPSRFLAETLPGARYEMIAKTGHGLNLEEPALVNGMVERFIASVEAKR